MTNNSALGLQKDRAQYQTELIESVVGRLFGNLHIVHVTLAHTGITHANERSVSMHCADRGAATIPILAPPFQGGVWGGFKNISLKKKQ